MLKKKTRVMKKLLLIIFALIPSLMFAQLQLPNGGFENWDENLEPSNWNTFVTAKCDIKTSNPSLTETLCKGAMKVKHAKSTDVRPDSEGEYSCLLFASKVLTYVANGNVTTGQIRMGTTDLKSKENYNITRTADKDLCQTFTGRPDSIRFWAKFRCPDSLQEARMKAIIHDKYDVRDPEETDSAKCYENIVAEAVINFTRGDQEWHEYTVPFEYLDNNAKAEYILLTFTTNKIAGAGSAFDSLLLDDVEFIYNDLGMNDFASKQARLSVYPNPAQDIVTVSYPNLKQGRATIFNLIGEKVMTYALNADETKINVANLRKGMYIIRVEDGNEIIGTQKLIVQ